MTVKLPDGIRRTVSPNDGTVVFIIDARDDEAVEQALAISRFNAALLRQFGQSTALVGSSPETARQAMARVQRHRPRGIAVRALCPVDGTFRYWVGYTNVALTDAEVAYVCRQCDRRPAPDLPTERTLIDLGGLELTRAEIRRAVRSSRH